MFRGDCMDAYCLPSPLQSSGCLADVRLSFSHDLRECIALNKSVRGVRVKDRSRTWGSTNGCFFIMWPWRAHVNSKPGQGDNEATRRIRDMPFLTEADLKTFFFREKAVAPHWPWRQGSRLCWCTGIWRYCWLCEHAATSASASPPYCSFWLW